MNTLIEPTRILDYIRDLLPWAHGHQIKSIAIFVVAIIEKQTGNQAELPRTLGNQEAAVKRLSRLIHNDRLKPRRLAAWICRQVLLKIPSSGKVRLAIDWTTEDIQHLLVISLIIGHRATPIYWHAYDQSMLKGRMKRYESAVIRNAFKTIFQLVDPSRVRLTADRGFPGHSLFELLDGLGVNFVIRVKGSTKVQYQGKWLKLNQIKFRRNERHRSLGRIDYCQNSPHRLQVSMSRVRDKEGKWGIWYLVTNQHLRARQAAKEYGFRFGCEGGFRDVKWDLGFKESRVRQVQAWSRLFALFAIALIALTTLAIKLFVRNGNTAQLLLRRVTSRKRKRCELSLVAAIIALIQQDPSFLNLLSINTKLKLLYDS